MVDGVNGQDHKRGVMANAADSMNAIRANIRDQQTQQDLVKKINEITERINALQPKLREAIANNNTKYIQEIGQQIQDLKTEQGKLIEQLSQMQKSGPQDSTAKAKGSSVFGDGFGLN